MKENGFLGIEWENIFENSYHNKKEDEDSFIDLRASFIAWYIYIYKSYIFFMDFRNLLVNILLKFLICVKQYVWYFLVTQKTILSLELRIYYFLLYALNAHCHPLMFLILYLFPTNLIVLHPNASTRKYALYLYPRHQTSERE